jgi:predicted transcriptional regulator
MHYNTSGPMRAAAMFAEGALSQADIARVLGVSHQAVPDWHVVWKTSGVPPSWKDHELDDRSRVRRSFTRSTTRSTLLVVVTCRVAAPSGRR